MDIFVIELLSHQLLEVDVLQLNLLFVPCSFVWVIIYQISFEIELATIIIPTKYAV